MQFAFNQNQLTQNQFITLSMFESTFISQKFIMFGFQLYNWLQPQSIIPKS